jgi:hypothetical protein
MILFSGYSVSKIVIARRHDEAILLQFSFGETPTDSINDYFFLASAKARRYERIPKAFKKIVNRVEEDESSQRLFY